MINRQLIMDVGLHTGQDTKNYLDMGFSVVAVEADPSLVDKARQRFAAEICDGRLTLVSGAVCKPELAGTPIPFFWHATKDWWGRRWTPAILRMTGTEYRSTYQASTPRACSPLDATTPRSTSKAPIISS